MARILVCLDDYELDIPVLTKYYEAEIRPSLTDRGHEVRLTTCAKVLEDIYNHSADVVLMFVPRRQSCCWQVARHMRETRKQNSLSPYILMIIAWGPDDSRDDPAYYVQPEYWVYDDYYRDFWYDSEIARWVDDCLARRAQQL